MMNQEPRFYRGNMNNERFRFFNVVNQETDLWIGVNPESYHHKIISYCEERVAFYRDELEKYIKKNPGFAESFTPTTLSGDFPEIAKTMTEAAKQTNTGPMAAVAGTYAEYVARDITKEFNPDEMVIENGGDIFVSIKNDLLVQFYAGSNNYFNRMALNIPSSTQNLGICSSSGTFGHSFSYGLADSVTVICKSVSLADAWATSICNKIKKKSDINIFISRIHEMPGILSLIIIKDDAIGIAGEFSLEMI